MQSTSAGVLEFEHLRELLGRYIASPLGRHHLDLVQPQSDREALEATLAETAEAIEYSRSASKPQAAVRGASIRLNFAGIVDLTDAVQKLRIEGAVLDPREIFDLLALLDRASDARSVLTAAAERFPGLGRRAAAIGDYREILRNFEGRILPDGTVADHASVALARLRRDIERQKRHIQESLERFLRAHRDDGSLQEEIVTIRNERFVVPVISGQRRKMNGVIHGASSSGHTLFVEPLETIDLNNELVRLTEEEMREVHRILRELTEQLRMSSASIQQTLETMGELEWLFAKGRFAVEFDCVVPRFSAPSDRRLTLKDARHPLLEDVLKRSHKRVIPISLTLDNDCRTLLISGPNTGGKTVTLKTVGLIALMAQSALPVPCAEAELPVFEQVLADIGDNQSIESSLSTFSAHMSHIREMALDVTPDSLVLLDEIGSATDPEEGGALGVALVDHFRAAGAFTLASTHLLALKIYGANTNTVLNASMGFDEETLQPTYRLNLGLPGKSAGLDIAARLGMPEDIMKRARASLSDREIDLARFLAELHQSVERATERERELEQERARLVEREKQMTADFQRRESAKVAQLEARVEELIERFEAQARETIERLQEKAGEMAQRKVAKVRREMREQLADAIVEKRPDQPARPKLEEGSRVRLNGIRDLARVRRLLSGDLVEVEAGFMKMQVSAADIVEVFPPADPGSAPSRLPQNVSYRSGPQLSPIFQEINVIGERADDAVDRVERFLDGAVMATASRVRIVHGHGMGILKKAIAQLLTASPHVEKFYQASQNEGGAGATIVELKE